MLYEKSGAVDTVRFLNQYTMGFGDYTRERETLLADTTLAEITAEIEHRRGGEVD